MDVQERRFSCAAVGASLKVPAIAAGAAFFLSIATAAVARNARVYVSVARATVLALGAGVTAYALRALLAYVVPDLLVQEDGKMPIPHVDLTLDDVVEPSFASPGGDVVQETDDSFDSLIPTGELGELGYSFSPSTPSFEDKTSDLVGDVLTDLPETKRMARAIRTVLSQDT
ncbi:hypothetical protein [Treponema pallidum]|uniref:Uncharacterized protein TP_0708 n=4 Tax=Treponema pallidum TaxID=160 RepID=Y708_TREPA|nr:hypothetical protein [Treponema pallidum]O83706.1 RecName: Full=Uncharacterized protein TP_0708 [Treponema pallidum subsp. pallidum str. Nichols]AAC65695.1 predicted coding region TP0708 [Treponema pallidum subsp. pallidum str. Nichols]ACD71126.1 hypothetical protein TPASS_0708 [Treponema pallidum subsp. pallidum SS14]ADD72808.1 conserved hypothetical protein [Treponema pallidum subsp. pallidum str. Chicago]AEZ57834.1 hypothetical protein TPESAMD_0708 [Treponema pallidum subsp. pertenue str